MGTMFFPDLGDLGHLTPHAAAAVLLEQRILDPLRKSLQEGEILRDALKGDGDWESVSGKANKLAANLCQLSDSLPEQSRAIADLVGAISRLYGSIRPSSKKTTRKQKPKGKKKNK